MRAQLRALTALGLTVLMAAAGTAVATGSSAPTASAPTQATPPAERVEVASLTTETRRVFAEPDGTHTAEFDVEPVRVQRGDDWVSVDTTLAVDDDGSITPKAVPVELALSGGGDGPLVQLGKDGQKTAISWPEPLPEPTVDGDTATYADVRPDVDLQVTATTLGYSTALVIKNRAAAEQADAINLGVTTTGVAMEADDDGTVAVDTDGTTVFQARSPAVQAGVAEVEFADDEVTVVPDAAVLNDPETEYPVVIEPYADRWESPRQTGFARIKGGRGYQDNSYWNDGKDAKAGNCGTWDNCNGIGRVRSYFQYDIGSLHGTEIIRADFKIHAKHLARCNARELAVWSSNRVGPTTDWDGHVQELREVQDVLRSRAGRDDPHIPGNECPPGRSHVGFNVKQAVEANVNARESVVTLLLKNATPADGSADFESNQNYWGRFDNTPTLTVNYNTRPDTPTKLSANAKRCTPGISNAVYVPTAQPMLRATVSDPDRDSVKARFEWDLSDQDGNRAGAPQDILASEFQSSPSEFAIRVTDTRFGNGSYIAYRAQGNDGKHDGDWSSHCYVGVDTVPPDREPTVSSPHYVECADEENCELSGSPGQSGLFTFEANDVDDVAGFCYGFEGENLDKCVSASPERDGTQRAAVMVTPHGEAGSGRRTLHVVSVDRAGNRGGTQHHYSYRFVVGDHTGPVGHWTLDGRGADPVAPDLSGHGHPGTVTGLDSSGGATWITGRSGDALRFGGSGYLQTSTEHELERIVHTDQAFTVSAWVRIPADAGGNWRTAVSQAGNQAAGYFLQYHGGRGELAFSMPHADERDTGTDRAIAALPATGEWTHLAGVYNPENPDNAGLSLYVNGQLAATASRPTNRRWHAAGPLQVGRGQWNGAWVDPWIGDIDDVQVHNRALSADEIKGRPDVRSYPTGLAGRPIERETFLPLGDGGTDAFDISGNNRTATLGSAASWGPGVDGDGTALDLNGTANAYAATRDPVVRTDQGFTVSAWVKADRLDHTHRVAVSQDGAQHSGFTLGYDHGRCVGGGTTCDPGQGQWAFTVPVAGSGPLSGMTATAGWAAGGDLDRWVHLAGALDLATGQVRLYVDGQPGNAYQLTPDQLNSRWNATGALQIGRGQRDGSPVNFLDGQVACVEVSTGVLTRGEIRAVQRFGCPEIPPTTVYGGQFTAWENHTGDRLTSTVGRAPQGYYATDALGLPAPADAEDTRMLYGCAAGERGGDGFTSADPDCEGQRRLGPIGLAYATPPGDVPTAPLYRCVINQPGHPALDHHFDSNDQNCDGIGRLEARLGYLTAYAHLVRYVYPGSHRTSTGGVPVRYRPEGVLGAVSTVPGAGLAALFACSSESSGTFTSLDPDCEGRDASGEPIGHIWTEPPPGLQSGQLYRCLNGEDYFDSLSDDCEGRQVDRELGYVVTSLETAQSTDTSGPEQE